MLKNHEVSNFAMKKSMQSNFLHCKEKFPFFQKLSEDFTLRSKELRTYFLMFIFKDLKFFRVLSELSVELSGFSQVNGLSMYSFFM